MCTYMHIYEILFMKFKVTPISVNTITIMNDNVICNYLLLHLFLCYCIVNA